MKETLFYYFSLLGIQLYHIIHCVDNPALHKVVFWTHLHKHLLYKFTSVANFLMESKAFRIYKTIETLNYEFLESFLGRAKYCMLCINVVYIIQSMCVDNTFYNAV